jgi:hypothetical protein
MDTIVAHTRSDGAYRAWADSQSDCWYGDEEEEEATLEFPKLRQLELFDLAAEIANTEGMPFMEAVGLSERLMPGLRSFAESWDRHCWLAGHEGCAAF